jgi:hypothetical protein
MKYHKERHKDTRYIRMEITPQNPFFKADVSFTFPSPSYKYELSDKELDRFANKLMLKWHETYDNMVNELLGTE